MQLKHNRKLTYLISGLVILAVAAVAALGFWHSTAAEPTAKATPAKPMSMFSFAGASDWRQGPSSHTSMALFHNSHDCFTSVEYKTGRVNAAVQLKKTTDSLASGGYQVTIEDSQAMALQTADGPQPYQLQQSSVTTPDRLTKVKGGQAFGYVQLSNGYVEVEAYCDQPDQLPATIPALQAIKFDSAS